MSNDKEIDGDGRDIEGWGDQRASGLPADGQAESPGHEPVGRPALAHWRESTITEAGLSARGNVFFAAVEMTRMPMILTDPNQPDNPVVFANKAFLDLTGYEEVEILGRNCRFLQGPQTDREVVAELRQAVAAREAVSVEVLNYRRDGSPFWNAVFIGPVYDVHGELLYFFASQLDVTRRRTTEAAYRQAQKMEAVGQLTAGLAHDFNNLLQVIEGNLGMLAERVADPSLSRLVERARAASDRGAKLTRQLLAFARKTRLESRQVQLSELVHEFSPLIETTIGRNIDLQLNLRRRLPNVMIDPDQFEMALLNVVANARDAMPSGGLLTITTAAVHLNGDAAARELPPGDYVLVEIEDEGDGMPEHVLQRAMEPFFTTKGVGKGTGLGLAMASGFAQQSRGRLELQNRPSKGLAARFLFPASRDVSASAPAQSASKPRQTEAPGAAILVVDDQPEILQLAAEILSAAGYEVSAAQDSSEALALLRSASRPYDLLFTDILMPGGLNGLQLAEQAKALAPNLPVLFTTGYAEDLVPEGADHRGLDVIGKPYRRSELLDRVAEALSKKAGGGPRRKASEFGAAES